MRYSTTLPDSLPWPADLPCAIDLPRLMQALTTVTDQRAPRGVRYPLAPMLAIAMLAKLCGYSQLEALADWAQHRAAGLVALFQLRRPTMPHARTWGRIMATAVDPSALTGALAHAFTAIDPYHVPLRGERLLILDGKTLRGTIPAGHTQGVHLVALFEPATGVVHAQQAVPSKANEITVAPTLMAACALDGAVVTGDAMYCQRTLSTQIRAQGGDYCWFVKANQATVLTDCIAALTPLLPLPGWSDPPQDWRTVTVWDQGHGRIEQRQLTATTMLNGYTAWPDLAQAIRYDRRWWNSQGQEQTETRYAITSLPPETADAARLLALVRGEWRIENGLHYRRDESLREDRSLARRGQSLAVLAGLNNAMILLLTRAGQDNLPRLQRAMEAKLIVWLASLGS